MKRCLIILERIEEAKYFTESIYKNKENLCDYKVLSMNPNVRAYLLENGINSMSTADFTDRSFYETMLDKTREISRYVNKESRIGSYFINTISYFFNIICRYFLWNIELLNRCLQVDKYDVIYAFKYDISDAKTPVVSYEQLYLGNLAEELCAKRGIKFRPLKIPPPVFKRKTNMPKLSFYLKMCSLISWFILCIARIFVSYKNNVLVPSMKYYLDDVCSKLIKKDKHVAIATYSVGQSGLKEIIQAIGILINVIGKGRPVQRRFNWKCPVAFIVPITTFARCFCKSYQNKDQKKYIDLLIASVGEDKYKVMGFGGIDLRKYVVHKLSTGLSPYMLNLHLMAYGLEKGIEFLKPKHIISQMALGLNGALGYISRKLRDPSVLISHGSHILHPNSYALYEHEMMARAILVGDYKFFAVQSPFARDLAIGMTDDPSKIICIEPILWGKKINKQSRKDRKQLTIVHAGSFKLRHNRWYIYESADEFLQGVLDLCEIISKLPNLKLILKLRPDSELSLETIMKFIPSASNISVETEKSFLEVLKITDLLVSFSSTTIEEALNNKIPVLLYGGAGRYSHIPCTPFSNNDKINNAVTFVSEKKALEKYLNRLSRNTSNFVVSDTDFNPYLFGENKTVDFSEWVLKTT